MVRLVLSIYVLVMGDMFCEIYHSLQPTTTIHEYSTILQLFIYLFILAIYSIFKFFF